MNLDCDVVIVGAGLAGLSAARALVDKGATVTVVEARDRVGGRTFSQAPSRAVSDGDRARIDLGGQWIGPHHRRMARLASDLGAATFPTFSEGRKLLDLGGAVSTYKSTIPSLPLTSLIDLQWTIRKIDKLTALVPLDHPESARDAAEFDATTVADWARREIRTAPVRAVFDIALRTVFGAEAGELSLLYFLHYLHSSGGFLQLIEIKGGAQQDRFVEGAMTIAERMADRLSDRVKLSSPVRAIRQEAGAVIVYTDGRALSAKRVVVAIPPALAGRIDYQPLLPAARDQLTQRMPMAATVKILFFFDRAFWREQGFSGEAISDLGPLSAVFDDCGRDGEFPCLLGFVVGESARRWSARSEADRRAAAIAHLVRLFGRDAANPHSILEQDWSTEEWTRGCPIGVMGPGTLSHYASQLREPVGLIHWAGTETSTEFCGYMEGAVASGERVAREILETLK